MANKRTSYSALLIAAFVALVLVAGGAWAVWTFFEAYITPDWTRGIAILTVALLPVIGWASYKLGLTESRGKLRGIDQGVSRVMGAASAVADLRPTLAQRMRQATQPEPPVVVLPEPVITMRQLGGGEVEL